MNISAKMALLFQEKLMRIAPLIMEMSVKTTTISDSIHRIHKIILLEGSNYEHKGLNGKIKISLDRIQLVKTPSAKIHFPVDLQAI
jgi:hypothetical protein